MKYALNETKVKNAKLGADKKPYKMTDGGGLHLYISASGARLWRYKYRLGGKENVYSIGQYPDVGLAQARELHAQARKLVEEGVPPKVKREAEKQVKLAEAECTFKSMAAEWLASKQPNVSSTYFSQIADILESDVLPIIGAMPIKQVSAAHVLGVLKKIDNRGAKTVAILAQQLCSQVFCYAIQHLKADVDPTAALRGVIKREPVQHNRPLKPDEISTLLKKLGTNGGHRTTRIAIELLLLTFVRTAEMRKAEWTEFSLEDRLWRIPAHKMKMKKEHLVPLSTQAIKLLEELKGITGGSRWLFPNYRRPTECMTATTVNAALKRMGLAGDGSIGFSGHGFRGTASTLLHEQDFPHEWIERQLAHAQRNKVAASYNQAQYLPQRSEMMQKWANYIDTLTPSN